VITNCGTQKRARQIRKPGTKGVRQGSGGKRLLRPNAGGLKGLGEKNFSTRVGKTGGKKAFVPHGLLGPILGRALQKQVMTKFQFKYAKENEEEKEGEAGE